MNADHRSPLAKARDEYLESVGSDCTAATLGTNNPDYYLRNRIASAFETGARWQEVQAARVREANNDLRKKLKALEARFTAYKQSHP